MDLNLYASVLQPLTLVFHRACEARPVWSRRRWESCNAWGWEFASRLQDTSGASKSLTDKKKNLEMELLTLKELRALAANCLFGAPQRVFFAG